MTFRHGNGLALPGTVRFTKNAPRGIFADGADGLRVGDAAPQLPRLSHPAHLHASYAGPPTGAGQHGKQFSVRPVDPVTQGAKGAGFRVIPGNGADAGDALLQIQPQLGALRGDLRRHPQSHFLIFPQDPHGHQALGGGQRIPDILGAGDGLAVDGADLISHAQPCRLGMFPQLLVKGRHRHRMVRKLQADHLSHRNQHLRAIGADGHYTNTKHHRKAADRQFFHGSALLFVCPFNMP